MTAATGDPKYLDFASRNWWLTSDYLYDKDEHLFYRDSRFFRSTRTQRREDFLVARQWLGPRRIGARPAIYAG